MRREMVRRSPEGRRLASWMACSRVEEHARARARVALVHQHRAALQQIAVALEREVEGGVEQRVARADEGGERLARRRDQLLLEGDALVAREHRIARRRSGGRGCAPAPGTWVIS